MNRKENMILADNLLDLRFIHRLSQKDLAEKAGVSRTVISKIENGFSDSVTLETLRKLSSALNTELFLFFKPKV